MTSILSLSVCPNVAKVRFTNQPLQYLEEEFNLCCFSENTICGFITESKQAGMITIHAAVNGRNTS